MTVTLECELWIIEDAAKPTEEGRRLIKPLAVTHSDQRGAPGIMTWGNGLRLIRILHPGMRVEILD